MLVNCSMSRNKMESSRHLMENLTPELRNVIVEMTAH